MCKKTLFWAAVLSILLTYNLQAEVIKSTWVGGAQGEWGNANNWNPAIVPDNNATYTFAVTINAGAGEAEVGLREWRTIDQLDCYGEVELRKWPHDWQKEPVELAVVGPNGLTNYGSLDIELDIHSNITNTTGAKIGLSGLEIHGDLYNHAQATIEVEAENDIHNGDLQNDGTLVIIPASDLLVEEGEIRNFGTITLYDGECSSEGIFDNNNNGIVTGFGVVWVGQLLRNKGQITAFGGSLAVVSDGDVINEGVLANHPVASLHIKPSLHTEPATDVNNNGTIEVNAGGGVAFDCNLVNEPNGVIKLLGGTLSATKITQKADANFAGFGGITGNVVIDSNGLIKLTGSTNIVGDVEIKDDAKLEVSDGLTLITGQTNCNGTIYMKGGYIIPQGGLSGDCNIIWQPGLYTNVADFNLDGQVNLEDFAYFADTWLWQAAWY